uniref:NADH-ubiquinone oxidoreductase chain 2 n=1 Tax=Sphaerobolus stellatus TaxID=68786 RepID=A0A7D4ZE80_9AGAM|nr:NADH dehydrogenase subunit 2 [Sphaerobolus stellatus]
MILITILILILALSISKYETKLSSTETTRISILSFIYAGALGFNALYIQSIGSGIALYCGLFQVTYTSLFFETFLYLIGGIILLSFTLIYTFKDKSSSNSNSNSQVNIFNESESELRLRVGGEDFINTLVKESSDTKGHILNNSNYKDTPVLLGLLDKKSGTFNSNNLLGSLGDLNLIGGKEPVKITIRESLNTSSFIGDYYLSDVKSSQEFKYYSLIALFSTLGGSLLLSSADLLSMYLSIELQSFSLYVLATIYRNSGATSAGLKYFLLGGLASCLILLGGALLYALTGLTGFDSIYSLVSALSSINPLSYLSSTQGEISDISNLGLVAESLSLGEIIGNYSIALSSTKVFHLGLSLGLILLVVGFLIKIAAAPFHNWAPDVYNESPTPITIWLTIMPKIAIVLFLLEIYSNMALPVSLGSSILDSGLSSNLINITDPLSLSLNENSLNVSGSGEINLFNNSNLIEIVDTLNWTAAEGLLKNIFLISSLLSLVIGTVVGLAQNQIKRLLAYSTISHVGFLLLALAIKTESSTESLLFYLIQYTLTNLNAFFILLAFGAIINSFIKKGPMAEVKSDIVYINELRKQFLNNPILSLSFATCLFSMAGIPPLIGFFGKQSVLLSAIGSGYYFMAIVAIVVSVISASYYLRIIKDLGTVEEKIDSQISNINSHKNKYSDSDLNLTDEIRLLNITNIHAFIISALTLTILFFVLKPSIILNSVLLCTLNYFYL